MNYKSDIYNMDRKDLIEIVTLQERLIKILQNDLGRTTTAVKRALNYLEK